MIERLRRLRFRLQLAVTMSPSRRGLLIGREGMRRMAFEMVYPSPGPVRLPARPPIYSVHPVGECEVCDERRADGTYS